MPKNIPLTDFAYEHAKSSVELNKENQVLELMEKDAIIEKLRKEVEKSESENKFMVECANAVHVNFGGGSELYFGGGSELYFGGRSGPTYQKAARTHGSKYLDSDSDGNAKSSLRFGILRKFLGSLRKNSLELLIINYSNDGFPNCMNKHAETREELFYVKEDVMSGVMESTNKRNLNALKQFQKQDSGLVLSSGMDNGDDEVVGMFESTPEGIFAILDSESVNNTTKPSTDSNFCSKLKATCGAGKHRRYLEVKDRDFSIRHFAGEVSYSSEDFLNKKNDVKSMDVRRLEEKSGNKFMVECANAVHVNFGGGSGLYFGGRSGPTYQKAARTHGSKYLDFDSDGNAKSSLRFGILRKFLGSLRKNSLELLIINYSNDGFPNCMNKHAETREELFYVKEDVVSGVMESTNKRNLNALKQFRKQDSGLVLSSGMDNGDDEVVGMFESTVPGGIFAILDSESANNTTKPSTDSNFCSKLKATCGAGKHRRYLEVKDRDFSIRHFAGEVSYSSEDFLNKKNDVISMDVRRLEEKSGNKFMVECADAVHVKEAKAALRKFLQEKDRNFLSFSSEEQTRQVDLFYGASCFDKKAQDEAIKYIQKKRMEKAKEMMILEEEDEDRDDIFIIKIGIVYIFFLFLVLIRSLIFTIAAIFE